MRCPNDKHNFIQADVYTGETLYRCDKGGLEARAPMFSGMIFKEYFGSYIGGISHKWIPSDMRAEDKNKLHECLRSLDFDSFVTSPDLFRNFGVAGFCISNRLLCRFSNGKGFECLSPLFILKPSTETAAILFSYLRILWVFFSMIGFILAFIGKVRSEWGTKSRKLCNIGAGICWVLSYRLHTRKDTLVYIRGVLNDSTSGG